MAVNNILPPVSNLDSMWNIFEFELSTVFGFAPLIGLGIAIIAAVFVLKGGQGTESKKNAFILFASVMPILSLLGFLPLWVNLVTFVIISLIVRWLFDNS